MSNTIEIPSSGSGGGGTIPLNNIRVSKDHGNDGTGAIGDYNLPFQTIKAAAAAARAAIISTPALKNKIVIEVEAGEYDEDDILIHGTISCQPGVTITNTSALLIEQKEDGEEFKIIGRPDILDGGPGIFNNVYTFLNLHLELGRIYRDGSSPLQADELYIDCIDWDSSGLTTDYYECTNVLFKTEVYRTPSTRIRFTYTDPVTSTKPYHFNINIGYLDAVTNDYSSWGIGISGFDDIKDTTTNIHIDNGDYDETNTTAGNSELFYTSGLIGRITNNPIYASSNGITTPSLTATSSSKDLILSGTFNTRFTPFAGTPAITAKNLTVNCINNDPVHVGVTTYPIMDVFVIGDFNVNTVSYPKMPDTLKLHYISDNPSLGLQKKFDTTNGGSAYYLTENISNTKPSSLGDGSVDLQAPTSSLMFTWANLSGGFSKDNFVVSYTSTTVPDPLTIVGLNVVDNVPDTVTEISNCPIKFIKDTNYIEYTLIADPGETLKLNTFSALASVAAGTSYIVFEVSNGVTTSYSNTVAITNTSIGITNPILIDSGVIEGEVLRVRMYVWSTLANNLTSLRFVRHYGGSSLDTVLSDPTGRNSFATGVLNKVTGQYAAAIGIGNEATNHTSVAIGAHNDVHGSISFVAGHLNTVDAAVNTSMVLGRVCNVYSNYTVAIGYGLENSAAYGVVVGKYNTDIDNTISFAVGIGNHDGSRGNGLVVHSDVSDYTGAVVAPALTNDIIDNIDDGRVLITREYHSQFGVLKAVPTPDTLSVGYIPTINNLLGKESPGHNTLDLTSNVSASLLTWGLRVSPTLFIDYMAWTGFSDYIPSTTPIISNLTYTPDTVTEKAYILTGLSSAPTYDNTSYLRTNFQIDDGSTCHINDITISVKSALNLPQRPTFIIELEVDGITTTTDPVEVLSDEFTDLTIPIDLPIPEGEVVTMTIYPYNTDVTDAILFHSLTILAYYNTIPTDAAGSPGDNSFMYGEENFNASANSFVGGNKNTLLPPAGLTGLSKSFGFLVGTNNTSNGYANFVAGIYNTVDGQLSNVFGSDNTIESTAGYAFVLGLSNNISNTNYGGALGHGNVISGSNWSFAIGKSNTISGNASQTLGQNNSILGLLSYSVGTYNTIGGGEVIVVGHNNDSGNNNYISIFGQNNIVDAVRGVAVGNNCTVSAQYGIAMGYNAYTAGEYAIAIGDSTHADGAHSVAIGYGCTSDGVVAVSLGSGTAAEGNYSMSFNFDTVASGIASTAGGDSSNVSGNSAVAIGLDLRAVNEGQASFGKYNIEAVSSDVILSIGIGTSAIARKDGLRVLTGGEVMAPETTTAVIDSEPTGRILITKEWFIANNGGGGPGTATGFEFITENSQSGWRLIGRNPLNYGDIGTGALDASYSSGPSTDYGATGDYSTAFGAFNIASGQYSAVFGAANEASGVGSIAGGINSISSGIYSIALGGNSTSSGNYSAAFGEITESQGNYSFSAGGNTVAQNNYQTTFGTFNIGTDINTIFEVGVGTADISRKNGFQIKTTGEVEAPELTEALIDAGDDKVLTTKEWAVNGGLRETNNFPSNTARNYEVLTQAEFDGISPDSETIYFIV